MNSGNIERIVPEIQFESAELETTTFSLRLEVIKGELFADKIHIELDVKDKPKIIEDIGCKSSIGTEKFYEIDRAAISGGSVFFPTFRRIEGGFSTSSRTPASRSRKSGYLQEAMADLSEDLSYEEHRFVSSISTNDVTSLLTQ